MVFVKYGNLLPEAFDEAAWQVVPNTLWEVPRLFQIWVEKQVMELASTNEMQSGCKEEHSKKFPGCNTAVEMCGHLLICQEEGKVDEL